MGLFFQAVRQQALDRANSTIPDLESYIALRQDTSGCKPSWALIEYAYHLDIPDDVMNHPIIRSLGEAANDLVTWSNVQYSTSYLDRTALVTDCDDIVSIFLGHLFVRCRTIQR